MTMEHIFKAKQLKEELDVLRPIDKEQEQKIMQKFRLDWNYHSNNIEGNSLTYGETKALLLHGVTAQGKPLKDHFEVTGHNEAINWVLDMVKGDRPLTESFIRELHTLLLKKPYEVDAVTPDGHPTKKRINVGSYKSTPNHVKTKTGEIFYFATPQETPAEMNSLMQWYNDKITSNNVNPILVAAEFHYKFILIHPFDDGNGRTARILMNFILMKFGYPPVIVKTDDKENYYRVLRLADAGNLEPFIEYIANNLIRSLQIIIAGAKGESIEEPDDIDKEMALLEKQLTYHGKDLNKEVSIDIINDIYKNTILKIADALNIKLKRFESFFVHNDIFLEIDGETSYLNIRPETIFEKINKIIIVGRYSSLKKEKLDNFNFEFYIFFAFRQLNYSIAINNPDKPHIIKYYENLSTQEIDEIIKIIVTSFIKEVQYTLNK
jgi:Fic family protein